MGTFIETLAIASLENHISLVPQEIMKGRGYVSVQTYTILQAQRPRRSEGGGYPGLGKRSIIYPFVWLSRRHLHIHGTLFLRLPRKRALTEDRTSVRTQCFLRYNHTLLVQVLLLLCVQ